MHKKVMITISPEQYERAKNYGNNFSYTVRQALDYLLAKEATSLEREKEIIRMQEQIDTLKAYSVAEVSRAELMGWISAQKEPEALRGRIYELAASEKRNWEDIAREFKEGKRQVY